MIIARVRTAILDNMPLWHNKICRLYILGVSRIRGILQRQPSFEEFNCAEPAPPVLVPRSAIGSHSIPFRLPPWAVQGASEERRIPEKIFVVHWQKGRGTIPPSAIFKVLVSTLPANGRKHTGPCKGAEQKLPLATEIALIKWVEYLDRWGFPLHIVCWGRFVSVLDPGGQAPWGNTVHVCKRL